MEEKWDDVSTDIKTVNWRGEPIYLTGVRALRNTKTGQIRVYPYDVAQAEIRQIADKFDLMSRDVALLLVLYAKPGPFKKGEIIYKYHLNKMLFYQWKELEKEGYYETLPHDEFEAAKRGPIPSHLDEDLKRLIEKGLIQTRYEQWGVHKYQSSMRTILTEEGMRVGKDIWELVPMPYKELTLKVKEQIFPLDPITIREKVHREYPEYRLKYTDLDTE